MSNLDAEDRFRYAVQTFKKADNQARLAHGIGIDVQTFKMVMIDLDAAIPRLEGQMLGAAMLFKANCLYWLHWADMHTTPHHFDVDKDANSPERKEGLSLALKGRQMLVDLGSTDELEWAVGLIEFLKS